MVFIGSIMQVPFIFRGYTILFDNDSYLSLV